MSRRTIGFLGPKGTFTKLAVDTAFNGEEYIDYSTIPACIDAVKNNEIDLAVVPLENAIEGTVHLTLDYLIHQVRLPMVAELVVPIEQHLLVNKNFTGNLSDIQEVHSHSHAIAQCQQYLHKNMPQAQIQHSRSTAKAAELISRTDEPIAAIANELAAEEYEVTIKRRNIHDYSNNHTRFAVLAKETKTITINQARAGERTTALITLPSDYAGALHQVLSAFAWRRMNLTKIESRPTKTGLGDYFFIIDIDAPVDDVLFPGVKAELAALDCNLEVLGSYPVYHLTP